MLQCYEYCYTFSSLIKLTRLISEDGSKDMNRKLLLLPITLMSCFMSACSIGTGHITLDEMMNYHRESNFCYYRVCCDNSDEYGFASYSELYTDYDYSISEIIKTNIVDAEYVSKADGYSPYRLDHKYVEYRFETPTQHKRMDYFTITVFNDGMVETYAGGSGWLIFPKDQYTIYQISEESANKIISNIETTIEEIESIREKNRKEAEEYATLENFFNEYAKQENAFIRYSTRVETNSRNGVSREEYTIDDKDGDVIEDIMGLEFQFVDEYLGMGDVTNIEVRATDDWYLRIDCYTGNGYMLYAYEVPASIGGGECIQKYFAVNKGKLDTLDEKLSKIVKEKN